MKFNPLLRHCAFSSESGGKKWGLCSKHGKSGNNSLKSLMLDGSTGESCKYIHNIVALFVCLFVVASFRVYASDKQEL